MSETIFYLEGRGGMYLYHFIVYNLGGLYFILNDMYDIRVPNTSKLLEDKTKIVNRPSNFPIVFPIKIYMTDVLQFHREAFEIIKDKFVLIESLPKDKDYEIVSIYGTTTIQNNLCDNPHIIFPFLRNMFLEKMDYVMIPKKRIFITRKNSESQHSGVLKRYMWNETELMQRLTKYNFEYIQLEEYSMYDKIKLFIESEMVISTASGGLTNILFSNKNAKIIEILNHGTSGFIHDHYSLIAKTLGLNYNRYTNIEEDSNGNFTLDIPVFEEYLRTLL